MRVCRLAPSKSSGNPAHPTGHKHTKRTLYGGEIVNSEELERSLRDEFENYLRGVITELKQETAEFQQRIAAEFDRQRQSINESFAEFTARFDSENSLTRLLSQLSASTCAWRATRVPRSRPMHLPRPRNSSRRPPKRSNSSNRRRATMLFAMPSRISRARIHNPRS